MSSNNVGQYFGPILSTESDVINCVRAFLSTVTQCIKNFQMGCAMHNVESRLLIVDCGQNGLIYMFECCISKLVVRHTKN